jgi:NACHT domain
MDSPDFNSDDCLQGVLRWLSPIEYATIHSDVLTRRYEGTGLWLLNSPEFAAWLNGKPKTLFCPGIPGAGKTVMTSIVVEHLWGTFPEKTFLEHRTGIAFLYCSYGMHHEQKAVDLLSALLKQLVQELPSVPDSVKGLYSTHHDRKTRPSFDEISRTLLAMMDNFSRVFIIIDALDECGDDNGTRMKILSGIRNIQGKCDVKLMATSRFVATIMQEFEGDIMLEVRAHDEDVGKYLGCRLASERQLVPHVRRDPTLRDAIVNALVKKAEGMYVLVKP